MKSSEQRVIGQMKTHHQKRKRNVIYTSLENIKNVEWFWSQSEIKKFDRLWNEDTPIEEIALELERSEFAVFLLSLDRIYQEKIKPRNWKIW